MSISFWQDNTIKGECIEADIVIIGGGIAGASMAYWLSNEDSSLRVALVEKGSLCAGATGRNAGFITCGSVEHFNRLVEVHGATKASEIWRFSEENLKLLKDKIINPSSHDLGFEQKGSFSLASTQSEFNELKKTAQLMQGKGINVEVLEALGIESRLGASHFVGGIKYCDDATINPRQLTLEIIESAKKINPSLQIYEQNEVFDILKEADGGSIICTQNIKIKTSVVVLATNGYSKLFSEYFADKIYPTRGQILCTEPLELFMEGPCYANFVLDYFRQLPTGELLIGGFRQLEKDAEVGFSDETNPKIQKALEEFLKTHIPKMGSARITHRWSGVMGFSVDGQPMIGALPTDPQTYFLGGFTAHGLGLAFNTAKALVDTMFDRPTYEFISARRFS